MVLIPMLFACDTNVVDSNQQENTLAVQQEISINELAERYVKLTLLVGKHQDYYIDAYYGPKEWQEDAVKQPLPELLIHADLLLADIQKNKPETSEQLRYDMLMVQMRSVKAFIEILLGTPMSFNDESLALYDAISPSFSEDDFQHALTELDALLPGGGDLNTRLTEFNHQFIIPIEKLSTVFDAAITESRARTKLHIDLPEEENFTIEYVTNQPWSAYNWYKGNSFSLIQVNTDHPIHIERAIDLASHEGYPGHHVFNSLIEKHLVVAKGWVEYSVYPLYSPLSLLAEGSANYGIQVAYQYDERLQFERDVLFPLAGLNPNNVEKYYQIQSILSKLSYAGNVAAQKYLDGDMDKAETVVFLKKYAMSSDEKSKQRISFFERYRAYVINYNLGQDIVKNYVENQESGDVSKRWNIFANLLANPKSASMMKAEIKK